LTVKADSQSLTIYHQDREVVTYARCWRRGQTLGAERFEKELLDQRPAAHLSRTQQHLVAQLGARAAEYLRNLAQSDRALPRQIAELNELVRSYGPEAVAPKRSTRLPPRTPSAPTISPTSSASKVPRVRWNRPCGSRIRGSTN
jgi:hypothetical protein